MFPKYKESNKHMESVHTGEDHTAGDHKCEEPTEQDDICRLASSVNSTRAGSQKLSCLMKQKGLKCHPTKSVCIII